MNLIVSNYKKGKGNWKLNNSLLKDHTLQKRIEGEIELIICTYACTPYSQEYVKKNYKNDKIEFIIEIDLFWEVLLAQVRHVLISFGAKKKRKRNKKECELIQEISELESNITSNIGNETWKQQLKDKNNQLEEIRLYKLEGALVRSRWQQKFFGEKPTKFFLNLENKNFVSKHIRELKHGEKIINKPDEILEEMRNLYTTLFKNKKNISIEEKPLSHVKNNLIKLNDSEKEDMEKEITLDELHTIIEKSENNKSPGPDGYSNEFFKIFWPSIKIILLQLLNSYREKNKINPAQLEGIITCIPKGGKIRNNLKNWRPITLLNSIYKFFSAIIANRIKKVLPNLIHHDQKGFINGRFIGENSRLTYDIINECELQNLDK